jgi:hypothetical protein
MEDTRRQYVRRRADERCEYCRLPQIGHDERFSIDHVTPRKHGGVDAAENLALSCLRCNLFKGTNLSGVDPLTNAVTALFNPRRDSWDQHFQWNGPVLVGSTPIGRTTVRVLGMNSAERVQLRQLLVSEGILVI